MEVNEHWQRIAALARRVDLAADIAARPGDGYLFVARQIAGRRVDRPPQLAEPLARAFKSHVDRMRRILGNKIVDEILDLRIHVHSALPFIRSWSPNVIAANVRGISCWRQSSGEHRYQEAAEKQPQPAQLT